MLEALNTALTALQAARQGLDVTGNNIANVNTAGYARERVQQTDINNQNASFWSTGTKPGQGVQVTDITRITDQFLNAQSYQAHSQSGSLNASNSALDNIQTSFNEPSDTGLASQMSDFWNSWDKLATNANDPATESAITGKAQTLIQNMQAINTQLTQQSASSSATLKGDVNQINSYATSLANLNTAIQVQTNAGTTPNALMDQRDAILTKLSALANISVAPTKANGISVTIGGSSLVTDAKTTALQVDDTGTPTVLRWDSDGNAGTVTDGSVAQLTGGDAAGQLDVINNVVPKYQTLLNNVTSSLITTVNTQHEAGQDSTGVAGEAFFTGTNLNDIAVNQDLLDHPEKIAASAVGGSNQDISNATAMANLSTSLTGPDALYQQMITSLGTDASRVSSQAGIQQNITNNADSAVSSTSGVNLDEEMTNMVQFQNSYQAAAKYLSVVNSTMDSLLAMIG